MSPVATAVQVPVRVTLRLDELVLAARLGDLPLPVRTDGAVTAPRLTERLAGTAAGDAREALADALARVDDDGPDGARASLVARGLLEGERVDPGVSAALAVLAGGTLGGLLDVTVVRAEGDLRLRTWCGVSASEVAQLSTVDGLDFELTWFAPELWVTQLTRAVSVEPWVPRPAPMTLPVHVALPSELLAGSVKAHRERRTDLLPAMATQHVGRVRLGDASGTRTADADEVLRLLHTLGTATRGRLRLLLHRRDRGREDPLAVASWLLFDDGWHELRPGRSATAVLRRRDARDLGLFSWSAIAQVIGFPEVRA